MPKCLKCKEEINTLYFSKTRNITGSVGLDKDGDMEFDEDYNIHDQQEPYAYRCPDCDEILFEDDEEAEKFLRNKKGDKDHA